MPAKLLPSITALRLNDMEAFCRELIPTLSKVKVERLPAELNKTKVQKMQKAISVKRYQLTKNKWIRSFVYYE
jgi:hypothetical protein